MISKFGKGSKELVFREKAIYNTYNLYRKRFFGLWHQVIAVMDIGSFSDTTGTSYRVRIKNKLERSESYITNEVHGWQEFHSLITKKEEYFKKK